MEYEVKMHEVNPSPPPVESITLTLTPREFALLANVLYSSMNGNSFERKVLEGIPSIAHDLFPGIKLGSSHNCCHTDVLRYFDGSS